MPAFSVRIYSHIAEMAFLNHGKWLLGYYELHVRRREGWTQLFYTWKLELPNRSGTVQENLRYSLTMGDSYCAPPFCYNIKYFLKLFPPLPLNDTVSMPTTWITGCETSDGLLGKSLLNMWKWAHAVKQTYLKALLISSNFLRVLYIFLTQPLKLYLRLMYSGICLHLNCFLPHTSQCKWKNI